MANKRNYVLFTLSRRRYGDTGDAYQWYQSYYSRKGLVHRIAGTYGYEHFILNNLSKDMSETTCRTRWVENKSYFGNGYIIEDHIYYIAKIDRNAIKVVKAEELIDEVLDEVVRLEVKKEKRRKAREAEKRIENSYVFRKDPIPKVHNYKNCHRGDYYRCVKTTNARRQAYYEDDDYGIKIRDARVSSLPNAWDEIVRHKDKSWKTSCKVKKQWQKHSNKHRDTIRYNKRNFDICSEND